MTELRQLRDALRSAHRRHDRYRHGRVVRHRAAHRGAYVGAAAAHSPPRRSHVMPICVMSLFALLLEVLAHRACAGARRRRIILPQEYSWSN